MSLALTAAISAAEVVESGRFANVKVYVAPITGGTQEERDYFDFNLPEEVKGGGYELANETYPDPFEAKSNSDFYITGVLEYDADAEEHVITLELYNTRTSALIITSGMGYDTTETMNDWNLTMIYNLMANAPISKSIDMDPNELAKYQLQEPPKEWPVYRWYLGLRLGYSTRTYTRPANLDPQLLDSNGLGNTFEVALHGSYQIKRFLAVQAEALFTMDFVSFRGFDPEGEDSKNLALFTDDFSSLSLMLPVSVKGTFRFSRFLVEPLVGIYFVLPLGAMNGPNLEEQTILERTKLDKPFTYSPPLGFTVGADLGMHLWRGILFLDVRYSADLGDTLWAGTPVYRRSMVTLSVGYKFGFGRIYNF